jgi:hypothetical protein
LRYWDFAVLHSPHQAPQVWAVRLPAAGRLRLDSLEEGVSTDIIGRGTSFAEAAHAALEQHAQDWCELRCAASFGLVPGHPEFGAPGNKKKRGAAAPPT